MNKQNISILVAVIAVLALVVVVIPKHNGFLGAASNPGSIALTPNSGQGDTASLLFQASSTGVTTPLIDIAGNYVGVISSTIGTFTTSLNIGGGTAITKYSCATSSWNPGSVASSGNALSDGNATSVVLSDVGAFTVGKPTLVGLTSATATTDFSLTANAQTSGSSTVWLRNWDSAALDLATGTVSVCQIK